VTAELRLASSKGQLGITNGISQWQQFPGEEVLNEIQGSLRAYSLVFIIQVFNSVIATKKYLTRRFQISLHDKFNTFLQYSEFMSDTRQILLENLARLIGNWQFGPPLNLLPSTLEFGKWVKPHPRSFQKSLLCLQTRELNNNRTSLFLNNFSALR
jgi:hypothetical protein